MAEELDYGHGKIENGALVYAPRTIRLTEERTETSTVYDEYDEDGNPVGDPREITVTVRSNGHLVRNPSESQLRNEGYKPVVVESRPEAVDGGHWEKAMPVDGENSIVIGWTWFEDAQAEAAPRLFSKLKLYAVLAKAGLWDTLVEWMKSQTVDGIDVYTAFMMAQELAEDNPMFAPFLKSAQTALGVDDATVEAILNASVLEV